MADEIRFSVPVFTHTSKSAFEDGLVLISAPDLNEDETDALRNHIVKQLGASVENPSLVVVNFDTTVVVLDEVKMRKMGWVRASARKSTV